MIQGLKSFLSNRSEPRVPFPVKILKSLVSELLAKREARLAAGFID